MIQSIKTYCDSLTGEFHSIPARRKEILDKFTLYIRNKVQENKPIRLVYVCTHNSRRSHFGQVWAQAAASYYKVPNVHTYSGGTEATAFHPNAIHALEKIGFQIKKTSEEKNPVYEVSYDLDEQPALCFSKTYDDKNNPQSGFAAIMTCSDAEENCPFIPGVELRIATTFDDPKEFDNTSQQDEKYSERCKQIALETFYVFSKINL
ncbi:MAG: protein-tyrosine-phosphatase [Bacteroidetes bacterium]|jgi:protein-tyrosine-phosphatase|nr:protein-tyrosine-phosphatase [Bacteroidota bacterium]